MAATMLTGCGKSAQESAGSTAGSTAGSAAASTAENTAGGELCRTGTFSDEGLSYLESNVFASIPYKQRKTHFTYKSYDIVCNQSSANSSIVCKAVPGYRMQTQILDIAYMPLLAGMLIGLLPLLRIISNIVTRPLRKLSLAIEEVSTGDFERQVEVTTYDEIAESIIALSELFRLVLSQGKGQIAVRQEINLISHYLQIQKMRFSKRMRI